MTASRCRVLVVDGDAEIRSVIEDLLIDQGFEVGQAANVDEAMDAIRSRTFDVLLCHLTLLRAAHERWRRNLFNLEPIPRVVAMSATGARADKNEANASLAKPFTRAQLVRALRPTD